MVEKQNQLQDQYEGICLMDFRGDFIRWTE